MAVPDANPEIVERGSLRLAKHGAHCVAGRRAREDQAEAFTQLEHRSAEGRPAQAQPVGEAARRKSAGEPLAQADPDIVQIAGPVGALGQPIARVRIGGEITSFVPIRGLKPAEPPLAVPDHEILMISAEKPAARDCLSHIGIDLPISDLIPVCRHRAAVATLRPSDPIVVLAPGRELLARNRRRNVRIDRKIERFVPRRVRGGNCNCGRGGGGRLRVACKSFVQELGELAADAVGKPGFEDLPLPDQS